jgi:D-glycerate 3-kinase
MDEAAQIDGLIAREGLPASFGVTVDRALRPLAKRIAAERARIGRPMVVGLCGSQGSGKSTFAAFLAALLRAAGLSAAVLSLDDLYLTRDERRTLAETHHPLLTTRGPPGTHDVALGLHTLHALTDTSHAPSPVALPRFDKAKDARTDSAEWPRAQAPVDVVLFEGWFVGARPQLEADLAAPVNALERDEDADGAWRRKVNAALAGDYQTLFARLDMLVLLQAPSFERVHAWRALQEEKLAARLAAEHRGGEVMDGPALTRFIMHYERLTRWILSEMPERADIVVRLGPDHEVIEVR